MGRLFKNALITCTVLFVPLVILLTLSYFGYLNKSSPPKLTGIPDLVVDPSAEVTYRLQEIAANLFVPWGMVFTSETRILVTERNGQIRVIENERLLDTPLLTLEDISATNEEGLMGVALSPDYTNNKQFYVCYAYERDGKLFNQIVKLKDEGNKATIENVILSDIPSAQFHAGCRIKFGPDNKMYVTTGDAADKDLAQDKDSLAGKILRLNEDGSIPDDNPFSNYVYSLGHRNSQGIAWNKDGTVLYSTEHGPSLFDGPAGGDEINLIQKGANYGWPLVSHNKVKEGLEDPLTTYTPAVAPASALVYSGKMFPQFQDNLFFGGLKGEGLFKVVFSKDDPYKIVDSGKLKEVTFGRIRDVVEAPNGEIWFSTSNRDGRGELQKNDDKIYKITKL